MGSLQFFVYMFTIVVMIMLAGSVTTVQSQLQICGSDGYVDQRDALFASERKMYFAAGETLSSEEKIVDRYLGILKQLDFDVDNFPPAHFFLDANFRQVIEASRSLPILKRMPKGGNLHIHLSGAGDGPWVVNYLLQSDYSQYLYFNQVEQYLGIYKNPAAVPAGYTRLVLDNSTAKFLLNGIAYTALAETDPQLFKYLNYDSSQMWVDFQQKFDFFSDVLKYKELFVAYTRKVLNDAAQDNLQYIEFRHEPGKVFDFDASGNAVIIGVDAELNEIIKAVEETKQQYPTFYGMRLIWPTRRSKDLNKIQDAVSLAHAYSQNYSFIAGFDLIGEEDNGYTLFHSMSVLAANKGKVPYIFHAGETNWGSDFNPSNGPDVPTDENIIDATVLSSLRIGHAVDLFKHPALFDLVKTRGIAIEVSPISNQVLRFVQDLREHPAIEYLALGIPVSICSDDPGVFGQKDLSYDLWEAFNAWGLTLAGLKKLVRNSIDYSTLPTAQKEELTLSWLERWYSWVDSMTLEACSFADVSYVDDMWINVPCGPTTGGTPLVLNATQLTGSPLGLCDKVTCRFGDVVTAGQVWTASQVFCYSPPVTLEGNVPVSVQLLNTRNTAGASESEVVVLGNFTYYASTPSNNNDNNGDGGDNVALIVSLSVILPVCFFCALFTASAAVILFFVNKMKKSLTHHQAAQADSVTYERML